VFDGALKLRTKKVLPHIEASNNLRLVYPGAVTFCVGTSQGGRSMHEATQDREEECVQDTLNVFSAWKQTEIQIKQLSQTQQSLIALLRYKISGEELIDHPCRRNLASLSF